jgi:hypothetical protein
LQNMSKFICMYFLATKAMTLDNILSVCWGKKVREKGETKVI